MMPAPRRSSLIDAVDAGDRPIGVVERGLVRDLNANFRVVHILVFDGAGRLLLQQLGRERERNPLLWGSSVAGYLYASEAEWAAARRRLSEELGLESPLKKHGGLTMMDEGSTKFITVFTTQADQVEIREPHHIERVEYQDLDRIAEDVSARPGIFTPTFRQVFRFYWATRTLA